MKIRIVINNPNSWFHPFAKDLHDKLSSSAEVRLLETAESIETGNDLAFFLSYEKKVTRDQLARSRSNIVVHASDLPKGKGMSPLTWQILEGKDSIPLTLFEVVEAFDAGPVYLKDAVQFKGNELLAEMQEVLGNKIVEMCLRFVRGWPSILATAVPQTGTETFYRRRTAQDSELDPGKTIADQFNLLRVVDNDRYPAFFEWRGRKYTIKINAVEQ